MNNSLLRAIAVTGVSLVMASAAFAQDAAPVAVSEITDKIVEYERPGWHPRLKFNGNFSMGQSQNVPGTTNGYTLQLGSLLNATADYLGKKKNHEWTNALLWELGYTKTATDNLDYWTKSTDRLMFETAWLYHLPKARWMGPFVSFKLTTSILPSYETRSDSASVVRLEPDQAVTENPAGLPVDENGAVAPFTNHGPGARIELTDAFEPLSLRETLGFFAKPVTKTAFSLETRLGLGAWQTFEQDGYRLDDNDDTSFLELTRLEYSTQLGVEWKTMIDGMLKNDLITYGLSALFMYPFIDNSDGTLTGLEKLNMEFEGYLGVQISRYVSINYTFSALKQPLFVDEFQIRNNLMISVGFDLIGNAPPDESEAEPCNCDAAVSAARTDWEAAQAADKEAPSAEGELTAPASTIANPSADVNPDVSVDTPAENATPPSATE